MACILSKEQEDCTSVLVGYWWLTLKHFQTEACSYVHGVCIRGIGSVVTWLEFRSNRFILCTDHSALKQALTAADIREN